MSRNAIKSVKNLEHLLNLEVLAMKNNSIASIPALRLLSMNKMLAHLDLDGNPIVDTDERQRRKNVTNLLNLLPTLRSLGSIPCVSLQSKEKKMCQSSDHKTGKRLLDVEQIPNSHVLWVSNACDILKLYQDAEIQQKNCDYDDEWGADKDDVVADRPRKVLTREEQRQRDELRSRAIAFRSRGKAVPSPPKQKSSAYSFGPPLPPPTPKKKAPTADRSVVLKQKQRSSELSAPKHPPVDTVMLQQEKKRKSRSAFDINMSVAERLQLTKDKAQRSNSMAGCKTIGPRKSTGTGTHHAKPMGATQCNQPPQVITSNLSTETQSPTMNLIGKDCEDVIEFRIEPLRTSPIRATESSSSVKPQQTTPVRVKELSPIQLKTELSMMVTAVPDTKLVAAVENNFLHTLAVTDFLNHAEEEFSTAVTALTVLLSMSEKANGDPNKLIGYRRSLAALDILDEQESHVLYNKVRGYGDASRVTDCDSAFERLRVVKKCLKQLLERLDVNSPGSSLIRAFCKSLRTTELCNIVSSESEVGDATESFEATAQTSIITEPSSAKSSNIVGGLCPTNSIEAAVNESFSSSYDQEVSQPEGQNCIDTTQKQRVEVDHDEQTTAVDNEFDFLSTSDFDSGNNTLATEKTAVDQEPAINRFDDSLVNAEPTHAIDDDADVFMTSTDVTQDIQDTSDASVFDTEDSPFDAYESAVNALEAEKDPAEETQDRHFDEEVELNSSEFDEIVDSEGELDTEESTNEQDQADFAQETEPDVFEVHPDENETESHIEFATDGQTEKAEYEHEDNALGEAQETVEGQDEYEAESERASQEEYELEAQKTNHEHDAQETAEVEYDNEEETVAQDEAVEGEDEDDEEAETFGDWEKGFDPNSNHYFWFNHATGESSWVPPEGWPFEVDTPFEAEDTEEVGEEYASEDTTTYEEQSNEDEDVNEYGDREDSAVGQQGSTNSECDDDLFSDHDLPEF